MKPSDDPPRLSDASSDAPEILREAISAARSDRANREQLGRVAQRLTALVGIPVMPPAVPSPPWWTLPATKLGGVLLVAAALGGGALVLDHAPPKRGSPGGAPAASVSASHPADIVSAAPTVDEPALADAERRHRPESPEPADGSAHVAVPRQRAAVNAPPASTAQPRGPAPALAPETELALLQRAQEALDRDPSSALALAGRHATDFPMGAMVEEREVLAVGALVRLHRRDEARQRADRFRDRFPRSAYLHRLDVLLGR